MPDLHVNVCGAGVLELNPIATLAIRVSGSFRIAGIDLVDDYGWFGSRVLFGSGLLLVRSRSGHADQAMLLSVTAAVSSATELWLNYC